MAVVAQQPPASLDLSVEDIVMLGRIPYFKRMQWWPAPRDREVLDRIMRLTELNLLRRENFQNLSGGEQQRVMIALALAQQPELLWLDEPNLHLDISYQAEIFDLLRKLNREEDLTVVTVLHDLNLAGAYCRRLLFLKEGRVEKTGTGEELITPEEVERIFGARMEVISHPATGRPLIFPRG
jgi:iron complex transport system ATP-binding protein